MTNDHTTQTSSEIIESCFVFLNVIEDSFRHFSKIKETICNVAESLQENISDDSQENLPITQNEGSEPLLINKINYVAILALEALGIFDPSQSQIDTMESVIQLANKSKKLTAEEIEACVGNNTISKRILLRKLESLQD